jgi:hypothetical protein
MIQSSGTGLTSAKAVRIIFPNAEMLWVTN